VVVARCLGLTAPINLGRWAVRGLAIFPYDHGYHGFQQFVTDGKRAGFVPLNDKELYWFLTGRVTWTGSHSCAMFQQNIVYICMCVYVGNSN
jgi:hypothetical protein